MADWILIPSLKALFAEFDRIAPNRSKASDGSIGDAAHQKEVSDHNPDETGNVPIHDADHINEVHAIDVDNELRTNEPQFKAGGTTYYGMEAAVQFLLARCRAGKEKRLRYIIYNRRIWSASSGWVQKTYTGASAHTEHAHFSGSYVTALEADTSSWHLEELTGVSKQEVLDGLTEFFAVSKQPAAKGGLPESKIGHDASSQGVPDTIDGGTTYLWALLGKIGALTKGIAAKLDVPVSEVLAAVGQVDEQVLASLADAGRSDEDVAASLRAALGDRASAVGRILAGS